METLKGPKPLLTVADAIETIAAGPNPLEWNPPGHLEAVGKPKGKKLLEDELKQLNARHSKLLADYQELYQYCERILGQSEASLVRRESETERLKKDLQRSEELRRTMEEQAEQVKSLAERVLAENASLGTRSESMSRKLQGAAPRLERARELLKQTAQNLSELESSIRKFIESAAPGAGSGVAIRASKIFVEQLAMELESVRRLESMLNEAIKGIREP